MSKRGAAIAVHYAGIWQSEPSNCNWADLALRAHELPSGFGVLRFPPPQGATRPWRHATVCMSEPGDDDPIELHMICDKPEDDCAMILTVTAHFHRTGARLGLGHTVNFGHARRSPLGPASAHRRLRESLDERYRHGRKHS